MKDAIRSVQAIPGYKKGKHLLCRTDLVTSVPVLNEDNLKYRYIN
jgi:hypothetical protein